MTALDRDALVALARAFAGDPARWAPHVEHDPGRRTFHLLHDGEDATVWLLCWSPGHDTGFHDHDGSAAAIAVVEGVVREDRFTVGGVPIGRVLGEGDVLDVGPHDIHRVRHAGSGPAVTIHAYSPPLRSMGAYEVDPVTGVLRRRVLAERDELSPAGALAEGRLVNS